MDFLKLKARLGIDIDDYNKGLDDAEERASSVGEKIAGGLKTAAKVGMGALTVASGAVVKFTKDAVENYAEYEQLVGGVETLFKTSSDKVMKYAEDAYKTAGLSANEYMETVTSFSASLIQATGRGVQTDIDQLEEELDASYERQKRAYEDQYTEAKRAWQDRLDLAKKSKDANYEELKRQSEDELTELKRRNQDKLKELKQANKEQVEAAEAANNASVTTAESLEVAAEAANRAIIDMSDNANKMGTSMESIQNAYQGFAKQNYTMLDNLKLGYGGTKEEMQRLIEDASRLTDVQEELGVTVDANSMSFDNIVNAISVIQKEMGIAGTTAAEAGDTISGSVGMVKKAWENLVTGIANPNADLGKLIGDLVDSGVGAINNLIPIVEQALMGIANAIKKLAPIIIKRLPSFVKEMVPQLLKVGAEFLSAVVSGIVENAPALLEAAVELIMYFGEYLSENFDSMFETILGLITTIADFLVQNLPVLIPAAIGIILQIAETLTDPDNIMKLVDAAIAIIIALADGLINALPKLIEKAPVIVENLVTAIVKLVPKLWDAAKELMVHLIAGIVDNLGGLLDAAADIVFKLVEGIVEWLSELVKVGADIGNSIKEGFWEFVEAAKQWGADLIDNFIKGILQKWDDLKQTVADIATGIADYLGFSEPKKGPLSNFHTYAPDMMDLFAKGIEDNEDKITNAIEKSFDIEPTIQEAYESDASHAKSSENKGLVAALVAALRIVAPEFRTNVRIDGNRDRIVDIVVEENENSVYSSGRGLFET